MFSSSKFRMTGAAVIVAVTVAMTPSAPVCAQVPAAAETPLTCRNTVYIDVDALLHADALTPIRTQLDAWAAGSGDERSASTWLVVRDHINRAVFLDCTFGDESLIWVRLFGDADQAELERTLPTVQADSRIVREFPGGLEVLIGHSSAGWPSVELLEIDDRADMDEQSPTLRITLEEPDEAETEAGFVRSEVNVRFTDTLTLSAISTASDPARAAEWQGNLMAVAAHAAQTPTLAVAGIGDLLGNAEVSQSGNIATMRIHADAQQTARIVDLLVEIVASELE